MITVAAHHGTSVAALLVILVIAWAAVAAFYLAAGVNRGLGAWRDRRSIRRAQRQSVRAVRGLGAQLLADERDLAAPRLEITGEARVMSVNNYDISQSMLRHPSNRGGAR